MKRKVRRSVYDAIAQLNRFDIDTPISIEGDIYERRVFKQLETLRRSMRDVRDAQIAEKEKNKVAMAAVVHDLKTPLAIISGYAESLEDGMGDKDYLALIQQKTEEMNTNVLSLIETSRTEAQHYAERKESVEISEFFKEEAQKYVKLAKEKKISYVIGNAPYVTVYANRQQLSRVLQNLISNAIKYTQYGGKIKVRVRKVAKEIRIFVKDNGEGISKENLPYIFDKFFMADKSRGTSGSSGLGLFIAKEIVNEHGGEILVKSKKGRGTTFMVRLPVEMGGKIRQSLTARFNALPHQFKMLLFIIFGGLMCSLYRFQKYYETRQRTTLIAALLFFPFFLLGWACDVFSLAVSDKITLLAD